MGWSVFLLPFLFVLTPSLLMDGTTPQIVGNLARVLFGLFLGTAAIVGYALMPVSVGMRVLYGLIALLVVVPPEAFAGAIYFNFAGVSAGIGLLAFDYLRRRSLRAVPT